VSPAGTASEAARRDRLRGTAQRTTGRAELTARHPALASVSPAPGRLDRDAFAALLAADPDAAVLLLADLARATDAPLRAAARAVAARVFFRLARDGTRPARGIRRLGPGTAEGDLDLDRTLDRLGGAWPPDPGELVTSRWQARSRSVCLLLDTSGSMSGPAVAIAAVAAASLVIAADGALAPGVVTFAGGVSVLQPVGRRRPPADLLGDLLALRGHGMTDLAAALRAAAGQLAAAPAGQRVVLLLSDCLPTAGGDPAAALDGIDRVHVMCPATAVGEGGAAELLARRGRGQCLPVRRVADVAPALTRLLA
jgi:magnesium chelatase subunit D